MGFNFAFLLVLFVSLLHYPTLLTALHVDKRGVLCCRQLANQYSSLVSLANTNIFTDQQQGSSNGYWTQQERGLTPSCRFTPATAADVAGAVKLMTDQQCQFAVRGGGHMSFAGAANIEDGVTIDLGGMKQVTVSLDNTTTSVGGGARWVDVYQKLDSMQLAVSGGRVSDVGVGGLTLGGGNSFFGARYGFGCDGVRNFEVVLASGTIVNANATSNTDLFKALKGGSNNFGVVTRFDFITFPQGDIWGGFVIYPPTNLDQQTQALQGFTQASGDGMDPYAAVINSYIFTQAGLSFVANYYTHTKPEASPAIFKNFSAIQPQLQNTMRMATLTNLTFELGTGTPSGYRQLFGTATFKNDATLFAKILSLANSTFAPLQSVKDFQGSVTLQPITRAQTSKGGGAGGNSLGLDPSRGDLICKSSLCLYSKDFHLYLIVSIIFPYL